MNLQERRIEKESKTVLKIQLAVCQAFGVDHVDLLSPSHREAHAVPRFASYKLTRASTQLSDQNIAAAHNRRNLTTIRAGIERAKDLFELDKNFRQKFQKAESILKEEK